VKGMEKGEDEIKRGVGRGGRESGRGEGETRKIEGMWKVVSWVLGEWTFLTGCVVDTALRIEALIV